MIREKFKYMEVTTIHQPGFTPPWNKSQTNSHYLRLKNIETSRWQNMTYWPQDTDLIILNKKEALIAMFTVISKAIYGAMDPEMYCDVTGQDPKDKLTVRQFARSRDLTKMVLPLFNKLDRKMPPYNPVDLLGSMKSQGVKL